MQSWIDRLRAAIALALASCAICLKASNSTFGSRRPDIISNYFKALS
jgi:hypothetical protein